MTTPRTGLFLALALAACDSTSPDTDGTTYFRATLDGVTWEPDTTLGFAYGAPTDTSIHLTAFHRVSPTESQQITVYLQRWGTGPVPLGDISSAAVGLFSITQTDGDTAVGFISYTSTAESPGELVITHLERRDSLITGHLRFEAQSVPDTLPHHQIDVDFRIRYSLQPVFVPESARITLQSSPWLAGRM